MRLTKKKIDEQLIALQHHRHRNWGRIMHVLKRDFDEWATSKLAEKGYSLFKMAHMPLLMNIGLEGNTNNEVAEKAKVTKQAMSKVVKELDDQGYIRIEKHENDGRSSMIYLTDLGKRLQLESKQCVMQLTEEYKKIVGVKNYEIAVDVLLSIIDYHKNQ